MQAQFQRLRMHEELTLGLGDRARERSMSQFKHAKVHVFLTEAFMFHSAP